MSRRFVIIFATIVIIFVAIIPISIAIWYSYEEAYDDEVDRLKLVAKENADQIALLINKVDNAIKPLHELPANCEKSTVEKMILTEYGTPEIRFVGMLSESGKIICTSRGMINDDEADKFSDMIGKPGLTISGPMKTHFAPVLIMIISMPRSDNNILAAVILPQTIKHYLKANVGKYGYIALTREEQDATFAQNGVPVTIKKIKDVTYMDNDISMGHAKYSDDRIRTFVSAKVPNTNDLYVTLGVTKAWLLHNWYKIAIVLGSAAAILSALIILMVILLTRHRISIHGELEKALHKAELRVYYQPVIDLQTNRCVGAEALLRWHHPQKDIIRPDIFIPLAEDNGFIVPMTEWLIKQIIKEFGPVLKSDKNMHIAINLCPNHFENDQIVDLSKALFQQSGIDFHQITYEITERALIPHKDELPRKVMEKLKTLEANLALDDFGTGYSSLGYLSSFPLDYIKIDKQFTESIGTGAITEQLVESIIVMAKKLEHDVIAEGIETQEQVDYLTSRGVKLGQGWHYSKPLPITEFLAFMVHYNKSKDNQ